MCQNLQGQRLVFVPILNDQPCDVFRNFASSSFLVMMEGLRGCDPCFLA